MATFDRYHNIIRVKDRIIIPPAKDENMDTHCLSIWEVTKVTDGTITCRLIDEPDTECELYPDEFIKIS